jgi:hypothetical protein
MFTLRTPMMRHPLAVLTVLAAVLLTAPAANAAPAANTIIAAGCETEEVEIGLNPFSPDAEAHWTKCRNNGWTTVDGWVKDTNADGKCAYVYAIFTDGVGKRESARACPKDDVETFYFHEPANDASVYVRTIP